MRPCSPELPLAAPMLAWRHLVLAGRRRRLQLLLLAAVVLALVGVASMPRLVGQSEEAAGAKTKSTKNSSWETLGRAVVNGTYYYTVCNGFTNQLLCHAGHIAAAIKMNLPVVIPDAFILDGTQWAPNGSVLKNVMASPENSVPLDVIFDTEALLRRIHSLGGRARLGNVDGLGVAPKVCSFLGALLVGLPETVVKLLKSLVPSLRVQEILAQAQQQLKARLSTLSHQEGQGICVHHRDGADWHRHCSQWETLSPNNVNCWSSRPISELVEHRTSHLRNRWLFYAGDHAVPDDLRSGVAAVFTREDVFSETTRGLAAGLGGRRPLAALPRDLGAALDYFLCSSLPHFVGNSVSTWSAVQICQRGSMAAWYNSRFIPLADFLQAYVVPVVYTYTEEGGRRAKLMFQMSMMTTLRHMHASSVHVLYHGDRDMELRTWLTSRGVTVHDHDPAWRGEAERLRQAGLRGPSVQRHQFLSQGGYLGTWQRLDVPLHVSAEYCLVLDPDAFIFKEPTFRDVGAGITPTLAFSSGLDENLVAPVDSGVTLMNVPFMRETLADFRTFVFNRSSPEFVKGSAHHGAYLDFYGRNVTYLDQVFSLKPVYGKKHTWMNALAVHFHGLKPHDFVRFWLEGTCEPAKCHLLFASAQGKRPLLCGTLQVWVRGAMRDVGIVKRYCEEAVPKHVGLCKAFFESLASLKGRTSSCQKVLAKVIANRGLKLSEFPAWLAHPP